LKEKALKKTNIKIARGILFACLCVIAFSATAQTKSDKAAKRLPGDLHEGQYDPAPVENRQAGVRVARIRNRAELPGGPWATGEIDDYIIENEILSVVVRSENRPPLGDIPGAGNIVDIAFRDRKWDSLGGIRQMAWVGTTIDSVQYNNLRIILPQQTDQPPYLACFGTLSSHPDILAISAIRLESNSTEVVLQTRFYNQTSETLTLGGMDEVNWGALPIFVGGFGIPAVGKRNDLETYWVAGALDDFCVGVVEDSVEPFTVQTSFQNNSFLLYERKTLKADETLDLGRRLALGRGDMAPVALRSLQNTGHPFSYVEGQITDNETGKPVSRARVDIMRVDTPEAKKQVHSHAVAMADENGFYRFPLPLGKYAAQSAAPGRPPFPPVQVPFMVEKGRVARHDIKQLPESVLNLQVLDADTKTPVPARVRIVNVRADRAVVLGPPWSAAGARDTVWLLPGQNAIPLSPGSYKLLITRGLEYEAVERELTIDIKQATSMSVPLKRVVKTPGMFSVDLNLATEKSPESRVSADDLVRAAAGEGLEWIVSGDMNTVTDLNESIRRQGLETFLRASAGVHLSYQSRKLFGDFYVFPVPADTSPEKLGALAGPETSPAEFFANVRAAFPDALIAVMRPMFANASYLGYYGMNLNDFGMPDSPDFSMDFDAVMVFEGKSDVVSRQAWRLVERLHMQNLPRLPLASSRAASLSEQEPGFPRIYIALDPASDDLFKLTERDLVQALRDRRYQTTNGPIVRIRQNGFWPVASPYHATTGEMTVQVEIQAAPWVPFTGFVLKKGGTQARFFQTEAKPEVQRFPYNEESAIPERWKLYNENPETKEKTFVDSFIHLEATGVELPPWSAKHGMEAPRVFSVTAPILLDADGDGQFKFGR
jgi:hypothetical protein